MCQNTLDISHFVQCLSDVLFSCRNKVSPSSKPDILYNSQGFQTRESRSHYLSMDWSVAGGGTVAQYYSKEVIGSNPTSGPFCVEFTHPVYVNPVMDWWAVQGMSLPSTSTCWDKWVHIMHGLWSQKQLAFFQPEYTTGLFLPLLFLKKVCYEDLERPFNEYATSCRKKNTSV